MSMAGEQLGQILKGTVAIVGIGSRAHGDDQAGPVLLDRLRGRTTAVLFEAEEVPESYLGEIIACRPDAVLLVDAVDFGANPGEVSLFSSDDLRGRPALSTHRLPLRLVMEYLATETKARVLLLGIQPHRVSFGQGLSGPVRQTVDALADLLKGFLSAQIAEACSLSTGAITAKERGL